MSHYDDKGQWGIQDHPLFKLNLNPRLDIAGRYK